MTITTIKHFRMGQVCSRNPIGQIKAGQTNVSGLECQPAAGGLRNSGLGKAAAGKQIKVRPGNHGPFRRIVGDQRHRMMMFTTEMTGTAEAPQNHSAATGTDEVTLDSEAKTVTWVYTHEGLSGDMTAAHIHGPQPQPKPQDRLSTPRVKR